MNTAKCKRNIKIVNLQALLNANEIEKLLIYPSLCSTCVTYGTLCHAIGHQVLHTQPLPREVEDFPRGDRYFKHVPLLTYLIYLSPKDLYGSI